MQPLYLEHPAEDVLERFVMRKCADEELEVVETHILACDICVSKLEALEVNVAATKLAFAALPKKVEKQSVRAGFDWKRWFTIPRLSWAGASAAACALVFAAFLPANVTVAAYRGNENVPVPEWRPLTVHLNTPETTNPRLSAELVDGRNVVLWSGMVPVRGGHADLHLPRITKSGDYFLRVYTPADGTSDRELLNEYSLKAH